MESSNTRVFAIAPVPKPRMTQRDRWAQRPIVMRYFAYKTFMKKAWGDTPFPSEVQMIFYIEMPKSWSKKKKEAMIGKPHQQKPDGDNLEKAIFDSLCTDDSYIFHSEWYKYWSIVPCVFITDISE